MIGTFGSLLLRTCRRLESPGISPLTWALLFGTTLVSVDFGLRQDSLIEPYGQAIEAIANVLVVASTVLMFYAYWRLTREVADVRGRKGAVGPWLVWTIIAYLPVAVAAVVAGFRATEHSDYDMLAVTLLISGLSALMAPVLVHASGCAIDPENSNVGQVWNAWRGQFFALALAFAAFTLPFALLGDLVMVLVGEGTIPSILAAILYLPASILSTLLTVEAFHRVSHKAHS